MGKIVFAGLSIVENGRVTDIHFGSQGFFKMLYNDITLSDFCGNLSCHSHLFLE